MTSTAHKTRYLLDSEIEPIVMISPQGQTALSRGIGARLLAAAMKDLGRIRTEKRLRDWLEAIDERWFAARQRERSRRLAEIAAMERSGDNTAVTAAGLRLLEAPDRKEAALLERYGQPENAHA